MKVAMMLTKPPYGNVHAAEAVRHAMGALAEQINVSLLLVDGGVLLSKKGQQGAESGYTNLGESVGDLIDMGGEIFIDKSSVREFGLDAGDLIDNVKIVSSHEISDVVSTADKTMIF